MKKFLIGFVIVAALLAGLAGLGAGVYAINLAFENQQITAVNEQVETDLTSVAGYDPDPDQGDLAVALKSELQGGNTKLIWETGKVQFGKRSDFDGTWTSLGGAVAYNPQAEQLKALEVVILINSFNSYGSEQPAPGGLVNTVLGVGTPPPTGFDPWFNTESYPEANFSSTEIVPKTEGLESEFDNAPEGWTHLIKGTLDLNGKQEPIELPALIKFDGDTLHLETGFEISRAAFDVEPKNPLPGTTVDDTIQLTASVKAQPDAGLAIDALATLISDQGTKLAAQQQTIDGLNTKLSMISETLSKLERQIASGSVGSPKPAIDVADLPKAFTDQIVYPNKQPIDLEMVLVPGEGEVRPFYMAKHEVTWEMFYDWAYGADINANEYANLQAKEARPSPLYEDCNQLKLGLGDRPALSMSRTTAIAFAKWVSEQTGKTYRIPTDAEWQTALKLGGGVPQTKDELLKQAVFIDNAEEQFDPPFLTLTSTVGSKEPNALGIHDLLGNAAEWVTETGTEQFVRGGHFMEDAGRVTKDWKAVEDQFVWNETYPQLPVSKFWYRDMYFQGIRLVCDVP